MKIVVCAKQSSLLPNFVALTEDGSDVDPAYVESKINEPDVYATEEALRMRDKSSGGEVLAVTVGGEGADEAVRKCMTMGVDRGVRVWSEGMSIHDPIHVARALATAIEPEAPNLVLCGVQSTDAGQQSTGPALADALGLPCITLAVQVEHDQASERTVVWRELEGGAREVVGVNGPAVISVQTGLNEPRYGTFRDMMQAKKATVQVVDPGDLGLPGSKIRRIFVPEETGSRQVEMIEGGARAVAERIVELVREAR